MMASPGKSWESGGTVVEREPTCQRQMVCMEFSPHTSAIVGRHQWPRRRQHVHELMLMERGAFVLIERGGRHRAPPEGEAPRRLYCQALRSRAASRLSHSRLASYPLDPEPAVPAAHIHGCDATSRFWTLQVLAGRGWSRGKRPWVAAAAASPTHHPPPYSATRLLGYSAMLGKDRRPTGNSDGRARARSSWPQTTRPQTT